MKKRVIRNLQLDVLVSRGFCLFQFLSPVLTCFGSKSWNASVFERRTVLSLGLHSCFKAICFQGLMDCSRNP